MAVAPDGASRAHVAGDCMDDLVLTGPHARTGASTTCCHVTLNRRCTGHCRWPASGATNTRPWSICCSAWPTTPTRRPCCAPAASTSTSCAPIWASSSTRTLPAWPPTAPGDPKPTAGFQRVVQRAAIHVQSSGRDEVTGANVLVALFSERESHAVYFLQTAGHDAARRGELHQPRHRQGAGPLARSARCRAPAAAEGAPGAGARGEAEPAQPGRAVATTA